jgi:cytochrome-b5 reductase
MAFVQVDWKRSLVAQHGTVRYYASEPIADSASYKFELPSPNAVLGLPIGQHISVAAEIDGKDVIRSYTPTTSDEDKGHFDLVVKVGRSRDEIRADLARLMKRATSHATSRCSPSASRSGSRAPRASFSTRKCRFDARPHVLTGSRTLAPHLLMIAGGTGITPMYQILKSALSDPKDQTKLALIYANVEEDDIRKRTLCAERPTNRQCFARSSKPSRLARTVASSST